MKYRFTKLQQDKGITQLHFRKLYMDQLEYEYDNGDIFYQLDIKDNDNTTDYLNSNDFKNIFEIEMTEDETTWILTKTQAIKIWNDMIEISKCKYDKDLEEKHLTN